MVYGVSSRDVIYRETLSGRKKKELLFYMWEKERHQKKQEVPQTAEWPHMWRKPSRRGERRGVWCAATSLEVL